MELEKNKSASGFAKKFWEFLSGFMQDQFSKPSLFLALFLLLINLLLKTKYLTAADVNSDEPFSICISQFPVSSICGILFAGNNPPLHELLLHFWTNIFGLSPFSVRFLPCLFGSISVSLVYWLGSRFYNSKIGITAALIFTFSSFSLLISNTCRVYALVNMLGISSMLLFLYFLETRNRSTLLLLTVLNALIFYSHYFALWIPLIQSFYLLFSKPKIKQKLGDVVLQNVGLLLLISPAIYLFLVRVSQVASHSTWIKTVSGPEVIYNLLWTFSNAPVVSIICLCFFCVSVWFLITYRKQLERLDIIYCWFFIPLLLTFAISFVRGVFLDRYLYIISPAYYILVAYGAYSLGHLLNVRRKEIILLVPVAAMLLSFKIQDSSGTKTEISEAVNFIEQHQQDSVLTIVCPDWFDKNYAYYSNRTLFVNASGFEEVNSEVHLKSIRKNLQFVRSLSEVIIDTSFRQIQYLDYNSDFHYSNNGIAEWLNAKYKFKEDINLQSSSLKLTIYSSK